MRILPDGYTQLEYIQSSGTQYIDTGFKPNGNTRVVCDFQLSAAFTTSKALFGARDSTITYLYVFYHIASNAFRTDYYSNYANLTVPNELARMTVDKNKNVTTVAGVSNTYTAVTTQTPYNMYLFGVNQANTLTSPIAAKIYSCQIYNNGTLARNFIPCKNPSGEAGLYDLVYGVFYGNAGTGTFIAGPEFSYNEVEYIESGGTQYIDTGYVPNNNTEFEIKISHEGTNVNYFFGGGTTWQTNAVLVGAGAFSFGSYGAAQSIFATGKPYITSFKDFTLKYDDKNVVTVNVSAFQSSVSAYLFGINITAAADEFFTGKIYYAKFYDNGTLVRDYIPVVGTDGVAGLWDKVEQVFYGNAGTGSFIIGPELYGIDKHTVLLLHGEEIEDSSKNKLAITNNGVITSDLYSKFGGKSLYLNGSASLRVISEKFLITNGDFTIDWWQLKQNAGSFACLNPWYQGDGYSEFLLEHSGGNKLYSAFNNGDLWKAVSGAAAFAQETGTWIHWAIVKKANTITTYRNGTRYWSGNITGTYSNPEGGFLLGRHVPDNNPDYFAGYVDELRVSNVARYAGNFAVPTKAYAKNEKDEEPEIEPPMAPEAISVPYVDFANVLLVWSVSESASKYNVMRDGELIGTTEKAFFFDSKLAKESAYSYSITALNEGGESEPAGILAETTPFKLITDRTAEDVQAVLAAISTGVLPNNWLAGMKGAYNATDFNRVEAAVLFVLKRLEVAGWYLSVETKTDWTFVDFPNQAEMQRYLDNIRLLRAALPANIPAVPDTMRLLKYEDANRIEQILEMLDATVTNIMLNAYYANEIYSGEV